MDILDKIKQFISESIQSLFVRQKEDFSLIIHKEAFSIVSDLRTFVSEQWQSNERDMANMRQSIFALNQSIQKLINKLDTIQESVKQLEDNNKELSSAEGRVPLKPSKPKIKIYYATMVDSENPLGFEIKNLKNEENGCAFKITLKNDLDGNYELVDSREIQQEMLAAFTPLISDSSIYDFVPQNPSEISVIIPGTIVKENQILRIVTKQKIKII